MKKFLIPFAAMAAFAMFSCSDTKTPAGEKAELAKADLAKTEPAKTETAKVAETTQVVESTKTITLANGASVT